MQIIKALIFEAFGLRAGGIVEHGHLIHVAELEADALAVLQIDCGKKDHGFHLRKLRIRARPSVWLFSGWNWVPTMLSRPTMAVTAMP